MILDLSFAKILETILDNRIVFTNEAYNKIDTYNGVFLKGSQTQHNLLVINSLIEKTIVTS